VTPSLGSHYPQMECSTPDISHGVGPEPDWSYQAPSIPGVQQLVVEKLDQFTTVLGAKRARVQEQQELEQPTSHCTQLGCGMSFFRLA
jgi:hypothetical protein